MTVKKSNNKTSNNSSVSSLYDFGLPVLSLESLHTTTDADGLQYLKPGFSVTPAFDRAFAFGFPYVKCLQQHTTLSQGDVRSETLKLQYVRWRILPQVCYRTFRLLTCDGIRLTPVPGVVDITEEGERALSIAKPLNETEAGTALRWLLSEASPAFTFYTADLLLLLEACVGPEKAAELAIATLESASDAVLLRNDPGRAAMYYRLGFILLRCSKASAELYRSRLKVWLEQHVHILPSGTIKKRVKIEGVGSIWRNIDLVAHGKDAIDRSAFRVGTASDTSSIVLATVDLKAIKKAIEARPKGLVAPYDARLVFLGGEEVLEIIIRQMKSLPQEYLPRYTETFGLIRSPLVVKWLKSIVDKESSAAALLNQHKE